MLSRSIRINRTPGESPRPAVPRSGAEPSAGERALMGRVFRKGIVLVVLGSLLVLFLLLNMNGVVDPGVRLFSLHYERPGVLPVMLITSALSIACTVAARAVLHARRQVCESRRRSLTEVVEHEASRIKHGGAARLTAVQPVAAS